MSNSGPTSFEGYFSRLALFLPVPIYTLTWQYRFYSLHGRRSGLNMLFLILGLYVVSLLVIRIGVRSFAVYILKFVLTVTAGIITILYWPTNWD